MSPPPLIAIFGAALRPDGSPSPALLRRIGFGHAAALAHPEAPVLCSGGAGRAGPSEAAVMAEVLCALGVPADRLILDEESRDTFQNVVATAGHARRLASPHVVACSDAYHLPRIRMMLALLGVAAAPGPIPPGRGGAPLGHWLGMSLREGLAIPYDLTLMLARRRALAVRAAAS